MHHLLELAQMRLAHALARAPDPFVRAVTARRPVEIAGRRLDRRTQHALVLIELAGGPPLDRLPVAQARREYARFPRVFEAPPQPLARIDDDVIAGPAGPVPIRSYHGHAGAGASPRPVLVYYHGGGGVIGDLDTHDGLCRSLARALDGIVVSVAYRVGPEHPFPAAPDDALAAFRAVARRAADMGGDPRRIAVGGDSMGGCLAAVVCQLARDAGPSEPRPAAQWLLYPATDRVEHRESRRLLGHGFLLTEPLLEWFMERYLGGADPHDPRVSPLRHADLRGLPPAVIVTAGFDPLLDEGRAYADALAAAGVPVRYRCREGLVHGFAQMTGAVPEAHRAVLDAVAQLQACLREDQ